MANSVAFIRSLMNVEQTVENKGLAFTIKVSSYDNGMLRINGHGFRPKGSDATLSVARQILQMLEELQTQMSQRKASYTIRGKTAARTRKNRLRARKAVNTRRLKSQ